jgi:hypothetical protein
MMRCMRMILFCFSLFPVFAFSQTCIIIVRMDTAIYVGADSRRIYYVKGIDGAEHNEYAQVCKIQHQDNIYFSNSGFDVENAYRTARECAFREKNILGAATLYKKIRKQQIEAYLNEIKLQGKLEERRVLLKIFSTAFYGIEKKSAVVAKVWFTMVSKADEPIQITDSMKIYEPERNLRANVIMLGHYHEADSLFKLNIKKGMPTIDAIFHSIVLQSERTPESVGLPMSILAIFDDRSIWVMNKLDCN